MNFAFCPNDNYVMPYLACATSIYENNNGDECRIFIISSDICEESINRFRELADRYHQPLEVRQFNDDDLKELPDFGWPISAYYRFMIPQLVEESKILYVDGDIIIRQNLSELFETDLTDIPCAVVEDEYADNVAVHNRLRLDTPYFNSGVLLMNLDYWRTHECAKVLIDYISSHLDICKFFDQDALNVVFQGKVKFLSYTYNFQEQWYNSDLNNIQLNYKKFDEIYKYRDNPAILHFCMVDKPWYFKCSHPLRDEFVKYAEMHSDITRFKMTQYNTFWFRFVRHFCYFPTMRLLKYIGR